MVSGMFTLHDWDADASPGEAVGLGGEWGASGQHEADATAEEVPESEWDTVQNDRSDNNQRLTDLIFLNRVRFRSGVSNPLSCHFRL